MFRIYFVLFLSVFIFSCSTQSNKQSKIKSLESAVFTDTLKSQINAKVYNELLGEYEAYAKQYKSDTLSKIYLLKAAKLCLANNQFQRGIEFLSRIILQYPSWQRTPEALFLKGFVYDNSLHDLVNARAFYMLLIKNYPTSEYVDDAQGCLKLLGKSPDEIIDAFEKDSHLNISIRSLHH